MYKLISTTILALMIWLSFGFRPIEPRPETVSVKWYSFEEAVALSQKTPKKMFIDVYTDWCGWCKKMDKSTFTDPQVAQYLNENFYPVKFNAEQKDDVQFKGYTLKYLSDAGRRGVHELAYALLDGRLGYPAFVYLDGNQDRISISPGYKEPADLMSELVFIGEEHYKSMSFQEFREQRP